MTPKEGHEMTPYFMLGNMYTFYMSNYVKMCKYLGTLKVVLVLLFIKDSEVFKRIQENIGFRCPLVTKQKTEICNQR